MLMLALAVGAASAQQPLGTLVGVVVARESGDPLPYTVVAVPSLDIRRFSNENGAFVLRDLPSGSRVVQIRRLGYAPTEVTVLVRAGEQDSIRVELTRIAVKLAAVQVRADPPCTAPGLSAVKDSGLTTLLTQLRMNGEQYRLLSEAYPFVYAQERTITITLKTGEMRTDVDTILVESKQHWRYRPGRILTRVGRRGNLFFNIPTLSDFADSLFFASHCFHDGGIDHVDGSDLLRIDLVASARIKSPDVNGSIFLDPRTLQIRRSVLRLSRSPGVRGLTGLEVATVFQEALESVPIVSQVQAFQTYDPRDRTRDYVASHEYHGLIRFTFVGARPGDDVKP